MPDEIKNDEHCFTCDARLCEHISTAMDKLQDELSSEKTAHQETREKLKSFLQTSERWRVGTKVPRNIYCEDQPIAMLADEDTARSIAEKMNYAETIWRKVEQLQETSRKLKECQEELIRERQNVLTITATATALTDQVITSAKQLAEKERQLAAAITARDMNHEQWKPLKSELAEKERQVEELERELIDPTHPENHTACISNLAAALQHTRDVYTDKLAKQAKRIEELEAAKGFYADGYVDVKDCFSTAESESPVQPEAPKRKLTRYEEGALSMCWKCALPKKKCICVQPEAAPHVYTPEYHGECAECGEAKGHPAHIQPEAPTKECKHEYLDMDGICKSCGEDCRA